MNETSSVRLLIVDDHQVVREGLAIFLKHPEVEVIGLAASGREAIETATIEKPHVVLMDIRMDELDGLWALEQLKQLDTQIPVVLLSSYDNPTYVARAIALGASDYLLKSSSRDDILASLFRSAKREPAQSDSILERVRRSMAATNHLPTEVKEYALTGREIQVLRHIGLGLSNREIAKSLTISVETVKEHVQNILRKTKANDRTDAAVRAIRWGLVE